jgi:hypothetical protein
MAKRSTFRFARGRSREAPQSRAHRWLLDSSRYAFIWYTTGRVLRPAKLRWMSCALFAVGLSSSACPSSQRPSPRCGSTQIRRNHAPLRHGPWVPTSPPREGSWPLPSLTLRLVPTRVVMRPSDYMQWGALRGFSSPRIASRSTIPTESSGRRVHRCRHHGTTLQQRVSGKTSTSVAARLSRALTWAITIGRRWTIFGG